MDHYAPESDKVVTDNPPQEDKERGVADFICAELNKELAVQSALFSMGLIIGIIFTWFSWPSIPWIPIAILYVSLLVSCWGVYLYFKYNK